MICEVVKVIFGGYLILFVGYLYQDFEKGPTFTSLSFGQADWNFVRTCTILSISVYNQQRVLTERQWPHHDMHILWIGR